MGRKYCILVVEDEHTLRRLLEYRLSKQYEVLTAANGEEALDAVEGRVPDLIISDIMMPKMDGFALQNELQSRRATRAVPFIFLTAKADEQSRLKGTRTGVDDYITKPFDIEQLLTRVGRLLERTSQFQSQLAAEVGQDYSERLWPKSFPKEENYRIFAGHVEREDGGGDLLDWSRISDGSYLITIGDVMGKGMRAKFYAHTYMAYIRGIIQLQREVSTTPAGIMSTLNARILNDPLLEDIHASVLIMHWEPDHNRVTYANAGHCRPVIIDGNDASVVEYSDMILGLVPDAQFVNTIIELRESAALVAYTDGLSEEILKSGEMVGEQGVLEVARMAYREEDPIEFMLETIRQRGRTGSWSDDAIIFWLQRTGLNWFAPYAA